MILMMITMIMIILVIIMMHPTKASATVQQTDPWASAAARPAKHIVCVYIYIYIYDLHLAYPSRQRSKANESYKDFSL